MKSAFWKTDWFLGTVVVLAVLVFNHLISGAEAFVSAQLWDLPGQVSMQRVAGETRITARIPW